ncbi:hypothetical protein HN018_21965 (plasmid) [Lichenicola cladoniae]|uniref:Uncharacterized protein n=1 Tax=Lichenicola cladoniae TaxID=1484109 RepID=A0A6M8HXB2_9PROT|nr:hypothetical protein [Lichenicola cladoniae]NPD70090.1 hypothetical protein [Acetobacteraceae bacterium]QKE92896.1 hypothetical protein HN018_21965 [Lichenicola cladoniae]
MAAEIRQAPTDDAINLEEEPTLREILDFLPAMSRAQDVSFWTKERVRSTFKEDATRALQDALGETADIEDNTAVDPGLKEFQADLTIRPRGGGAGGIVTAVFLVQGDRYPHRGFGSCAGTKASSAERCACGCID